MGRLVPRHGRWLLVVFEMVYLDRIYTKSGDAGETSLGDGSRVRKTHPRIVAFGGVDELNAVLGVARAAGLGEPFTAWIAQIQNDLFDIGADLSVPEKPAEASSASATPPLRLRSEQVAWLEQRIDEVSSRLAPLKSFVLPGGTVASAYLHLARSVCRRAELNVWTLAEQETVNAEVARYLNRLSDLLFVMARAANDDGKTDILWRPGGR